MSKFDVEAIIQRFEAGDVDPADFDHRAHVMLAWCYLRRYPLLEAVTRFARALQAFTKQVGAEAKYHETITVAFLLLIADRTRTDETWAAFADRNPELIHGGMAALRRHYSSPALADEGARARFCLPDLSPPA